MCLRGSLAPSQDVGDCSEGPRCGFPGPQENGSLGVPPAVACRDHTMEVNHLCYRLWATANGPQRRAHVLEDHLRVVGVIPYELEIFTRIRCIGLLEKSFSGAGLRHGKC